MLSDAPATLLLGTATFSVSPAALISKCTLFRSRPELLSSPYAIQASCSEGEFRVFLSHIEGEPSPVAAASIPVLSLLAREFGFDDLESLLAQSAPRGGPPEARDALASDPSSLAAIRQFLRSLDERLVSVEREQARLSARVGRFQETIENRMALAFKNLIAINNRIQTLADPSDSDQPLVLDLAALKRAERARQDSELVVPVGCGVRDRLPQDGVIAYLTRRYGGHVDVCGTVAITASSVQGRFVPGNVANFMTVDLFASANLPYQWVCYDFKERRIDIVKYAIQTPNQYLNIPRCWVLEGSLDGNVWEELHRVDDGTRENGIIVNYPLAKTTTVRMVRIRNTGHNHGGDFNLLLGAFEVFGALHEP
jgi:hypothetical protein